jgi:murein DD-endopeptidase MepM/ murein hydrolase activator NlpD
MDNREESLAGPCVRHLQRVHLGVLSETIAHLSATVWRWGRDPSVVRALLGRYGAHLGIVALAFLLTALGHLAISPAALAGPENGQASSLSFFQHAAADLASAEPVVTVTPDPGYGFFANRASSPNAITRQANPLTNVPERVRLEVITYTVQPGDTVFGIALAFKLSPYTIVWSNMEVLQGAPWLLSPGLTLYIPPVDGAYHTVMEGETLDGIAKAFNVPTETLFNIWNPVDPAQPITEGALLVIPGGTGGDFEWEPPPPPTPVPVIAASPASGPARPMSPSTYRPASGSFILPTGSRAVSGWVFGDRRNPRHQGLDYRCRLGDPIYAADSGTVIYAGWGGGYGNLVQINHGNGFVTYYAHFTAFAVVNGQGVAQGQVVGYCGSTGFSTGPHLHYEIRYNGVPQNPAFYEP